MVHSVSGWTRGVQVKLWDASRTRAIPERLRGVFTTRRYANPRLPYLTRWRCGVEAYFLVLEFAQNRYENLKNALWENTPLTASLLSLYTLLLLTFNFWTLNLTLKCNTFCTRPRRSEYF